MKLRLTGDEGRKIYINGDSAILQPELSWGNMFPILKLNDEIEGEMPSPLSSLLFPNLLMGNDILLLTGEENQVSKAVYLNYLVHLLAKEEFTRSKGYYKGGPRAIVVVPSEDGVIKIHNQLMRYKSLVTLNTHKIFKGHLGTVVSMIGGSPSFGKGDDVVVATPKSLGDFFDRNPKKVKPFTHHLRFLVIDKGDECCSFGHRKLKSVLSKVTKKRPPNILIIAEAQGDCISELSSFMLHSRKVTVNCDFIFPAPKFVGVGDVGVTMEVGVGTVQEAFEEEIWRKTGVGTVQEAFEEEIQRKTGVGILQEACEEEIQRKTGVGTLQEACEEEIWRKTGVGTLQEAFEEEIWRKTGVDTLQEACEEEIWRKADATEPRQGDSGEKEIWRKADATEPRPGEEEIWRKVDATAPRQGGKEIVQMAHGNVAFSGGSKC